MNTLLILQRCFGLSAGRIGGKPAVSSEEVVALFPKAVYDDFLKHVFLWQTKQQKEHIC
jgi:hypothetical protein